ncbi:mitochondrial carrier domain-containing protein [Fimicolochytrium jonesii]|uniref:mitochondrial carrier domain-containing protein n=1 Tax=Fimicolochytrium jonesii TaxID=1396493 RepID=UPI0022FF3F98|nr:mitochondrial carrier domain-containing protein [Fimicolochytrium jonesii]KAI8826884.1 mitochondrial carrier domain-containing protein [Fimicolochytrium jonesii]
MAANAAATQPQLRAIQAPLPFHFSLVAGAIAGTTEILTMYPLDVVKTRLQLAVGAQQRTSIVGTFRHIIKTEGFGTLYRGIVPPILVEAPKRAIKFGANEQYTALYKSKFGWQSGSQLAVLTGVSAGITEAFIVATPELIKIRMQDNRNAGKYTGTAQCISTIFKEEGFRAFFRGLEATMWRHAVWNGGYFGVISTVRDIVPVAETKEGVLMRNFVCGAIGGTFATILNCPFDVVKTRIQSQLAAPYKYRGALPSLGLVLREEGPRALYKGFVPKVLRLGPGGGILLVVFETVSGYMRKHFM